MSDVPWNDRHLNFNTLYLCSTLMFGSLVNGIPRSAIRLNKKYIHKDYITNPCLTTQIVFGTFHSMLMKCLY